MSVLVAIEGCDSVGKNTQSKLLAAKLDSIGRSAVLFSFPRYETTIGKALRRHLLGEVIVADVTGGNRSLDRAVEDPLFFQALMLFDKADAAVDIQEHLHNERIVICDRWTPSSLCFGEADGLDPTLLQRAQECLPLADLHILIEVPEEEALRRRPKLRDRYEKNREKQAAVRKNYDILWTTQAEQDADGNWVRVDGVGTEEEVAARIWKYVAMLLGVE